MPLSPPSSSPTAQLTMGVTSRAICGTIVSKLVRNLVGRHGIPQRQVRQSDQGCFFWLSAGRCRRTWPSGSPTAAKHDGVGRLDRQQGGNHRFFYRFRRKITERMAARSGHSEGFADKAHPVRRVVMPEHVVCPSPLRDTVESRGRMRNVTVSAGTSAGSSKAPEAHVPVPHPVRSSGDATESIRPPTRRPERADAC